MIKIDCPAKRKEVIELLDGKEFNGIKFKLESEVGIKLTFTTSGDGDAIRVAKDLIKDKFKGAIYVRVT